MCKNRDRPNSFVSKLRTAREGRRYLGFSLRARGFINVFLFSWLGIIVAKNTEGKSKYTANDRFNWGNTYMSCSFTPGCIMLSAVNALLVLADLPPTLDNFQLAIQNFFGADAGPLELGRRCKCRFLNDFLDDGLCKLWRADMACGLSWNDTFRDSNEQFSFTASYLRFTSSNCALTSDWCLRSLGGEVSPNTLSGSILDSCGWLDPNDNMRARTARMSDNTSRSVVEEIVRWWWLDKLCLSLRWRRSRSLWSWREEGFAILTLIEFEGDKDVEVGARRIDVFEVVENKVGRVGRIWIC
jgi:hypothetical protein